MKIKILTLILFVVFFVSCSTREPSESRRYNVLFIAVDDLKPLLGCYGDSLVQTPNIDQLAQRGCVFLNNHCQVAVSGASRASLLTGMYADHTKIWSFENLRQANPDVVTLPQHFRNQGYKTVNLGKIFDYRTVDKYADSVSWDYVFPVSENDYYPHYSQQTGIAALYHYQSPEVKALYAKYKAEALAQGADTFAYAFRHISPATECMDVPDDGYKDGIFAKLAVEQINAFARDNTPFFLAVGFHKPHLPFVAPKKYWDLYQRDAIAPALFQSKAENGVDYAYTTSDELRKYTDEQGNKIYEPLKQGELLNADEQAKLIHAYMATVSFVDAQVGKIIQALKDNKLYDNTIIVLWGDHGWHLGDHGIWGKATVFEQATRSPLIISAPGLTQRSTHTPSEFIDIYPTLCALTGLPVPEHLDGESLVDVLQGKDADGYAISQFSRGPKMGYAIRDSRYRYIEWVEEGYHVNPRADLGKVADVELYDYEKDPLETVNLAGHADYAEIREQMAEKLRGFRQKEGL